MLAHEEHRSTSRVLDILELLASANEHGYTLTEIAEQIEAPKSSLFPIVHTLLKRRFLSIEQNTGKYTIGIGTFAIGSAYLDSQSLYAHIKDVMKIIVNECSEICQMGILDHAKVLYVAKVDSSESVRLISHIGKRLPASASSLGKALLMDHTFDDLQLLYPSSQELVKLTEYTVANLDILFNQLMEFRKTGLAVEYRESDSGICCFAIPLKQNGKILAAISVSIPIFRCTPEKVDLVKSSLLRARENIEKLLEETSGILDFHL